MESHLPPYFSQEMSEPGLLNPIPPCPPRASKRQNRGDTDLNGVVSPNMSWGKEKGKDEVEKIKWPKWGERILAGRRDPGSEFKMIHAITSGLFFFSSFNNNYMQLLFFTNQIKRLRTITIT